jgi:hypothetical protein
MMDLILIQQRELGAPAPVLASTNIHLKFCFYFHMPNPSLILFRNRLISFFPLFKAIHQLPIPHPRLMWFPFFVVFDLFIFLKFASMPFGFLPPAVFFHYCFIAVFKKIEENV